MKKLSKAQKALYVDAFLEVARPEILKRFSKLSCIATYTIAKRILEPTGIKVEAIPCRVLAYNPIWTEKYREHGFPSPEQMAEWTEEGAWSVGMGEFGQEPVEGEWLGHIALLISGHFFVDLCIDAFHRPEYNLDMEGKRLVMDIPNKAVKSGEPFQVMLGDGMLIYEADLRNTGYKKSPEYRITPAINETCSSIRQEMLKLFAEGNNGRTEPATA